MAPVGDADGAAIGAKEASDGHVGDVVTVRLLNVTPVIELIAVLHAAPLSAAVIVQSYTANCVSPSRSVQPRPTLPETTTDPIGTNWLNDSVDVALDAVGVGMFFCAHQICTPPHGHGPEKLIVIVMMLPLFRHAVRTKEFVAVMVPGAHLAVNTPAAAGELLRMAGATQPTAPAPASFLSNLRRSSSVVSFGLRIDEL